MRTSTLSFRMAGEFLVLSWQAWGGSADAWDGVLRRFPDYTVFQSYAWGEHKRCFGWQPLRLLAGDVDRPMAMVQVLVKRYPPGVGMAWIPGGPLGEIDLWSERMRLAIRAAVGVRFLYCRISPMRTYTEGSASKLAGLGWQRSSAPLAPGMSLAYPTRLTEEERLQACSSNWRHNFRRSMKRGLNAYLWDNPNPDEIMAAYETMQAHKQLKAQTSREEVESMLAAFADRCLLVRCDDAKGNLLALRGALVMGEKGWDTFAAATPAGRKVYASHAAFWELMKQCSKRGVCWYDMGGVDPVNNKGVYDFKKGAGAEEFSYLGEWGWATSAALRMAANFLIQRRSRSLR